jgi:predicted TIM-barrel fold metal-dependent hydrolase
MQPLFLFVTLNIPVYIMASSSEPACITRIKANAQRDSIDLSVLHFLDVALVDIASLSQSLASPLPNFDNASRIDTHVHPVPSWFRSLQPNAAGRETPSWNISSHLSFMAEHSIKRSILCISTPQANAFPGDRAKTVALARLLNEFSAELVRVFPERFSWLAVTALPYVTESVREVQYALEELGAVGVGVLTNHEALYPGDEKFDALWEYLQERDSDREVVFIHPTDPVLRLENGTLINSKPCKCLVSRTALK